MRTYIQLAALFVEEGGTYHSRPLVDPWGYSRDARSYAGPHPVVAHPPCQRWGRYWHGSTRKPHTHKLGADGGCFATALHAVRTWGGVLEHPCDSQAWKYFGLAVPKRGAGWIASDAYGGHSCYVEQGHYGHMSRKPTWLYACHTALPELTWAIGAQRLDPRMVERYGYAKARRIGMMALIGGKNKTALRDATPAAFRDVLLRIAGTTKVPKRKAEG